MNRHGLKQIKKKISSNIRFSKELYDELAKQMNNSNFSKETIEKMKSEQKSCLTRIECLEKRRNKITTQLKNVFPKKRKK